MLTEAVAVAAAAAVPSYGYRQKLLSDQLPLAARVVVAVPVVKPLSWLEARRIRPLEVLLVEVVAAVVLPPLAVVAQMVLMDRMEAARAAGPAVARAAAGIPEWKRFP